MENVKRVKSLWREKSGLGDSCMLMDKSLDCFNKGDIKAAVKLWWEAACTNVAIIPRLLMFEESAELGDHIEQDESWDYMNTNWDKWKDKKVFTALAVFWTHNKIRNSLGLLQIEKLDLRPFDPATDLDALVEDIKNAINGATPGGILTKRAAELKADKAWFIREIDRGKIPLPTEIGDRMAQIDNLLSNILLAYSVAIPSKEAFEKIMKDFGGLEFMQKELQDQTYEMHEFNKEISKNGDLSYIG